MTWRKMTGTSAVFDLGAGATKTAAAGVDGWYQSQLALRAEYERRALGRSVATPMTPPGFDPADHYRTVKPADRARIVG